MLERLPLPALARGEGCCQTGQWGLQKALLSIPRSGLTSNRDASQRRHRPTPTLACHILPTATAHGHGKVACPVLFCQTQISWSVPGVSSNMHVARENGEQCAVRRNREGAGALVIARSVPPAVLSCGNVRTGHVAIVINAKDVLLVGHLLKLAAKGTVRILGTDGHAFVLEEADDFDKEVELLGKSKKFRRFLNQRAKEPATMSLAEYVRTRE